MSTWAERAFFAALTDVTGGSLDVRTPTRTERVGTPADLNATLVVHDPRFYRRALEGDDIGIGESFMDGEWSSPDLVALARLMIRNRRILEDRRNIAGALKRLAASVARRLRDNSVAGSRRHIHQHYDLGNDFFRLFLDDTLQMYSSGYFETATDSLEQAQVNKVDRICRALQLGPNDRVLEIGSGWGGFAKWAATHYGCRVTTTTISEQQYRAVCDWKATAGPVGDRVEVLRSDYREVEGRFDKIVSIEMFEAVGLRHYDDYFGAADRLLTPAGTMLLQTITVDEQWFPHYHGSPDWIEKYIFPGGELASVGEIIASLARRTSLSMYAAENFGTHYARTLREWRRRFHAHLDAVRRQGFDERFVRMWDFYLGICEATFLERHTGVFQLMLVKNGTSQTLFNEPWADRTPQGVSEVTETVRRLSLEIV